MSMDAGDMGAGGAGAGGVGGAGGSGGAGTTHSGGPAPALTVLVNVPRAARQPHRSRIRHRRPGHVRILNHWVRGGMATVALHVPAAGHLVLKGRGLHRQRRRIGHAGRVVLRLRVTRAATASLRRRRRLRVRVTALFTPRRGARSRASALLTFHHHRQHRR